MEKLSNISNYVRFGNIGEIAAEVQVLLNEGYAAKQVLDDGLLAGMNEVGVLFKANDMFVPEVLMSAATMNSGMEVLKPLLNEGDVEKKGKVIMATVKGDLHDIGKKLVCMMMEGAGYEMIDLGTDVGPQAIVEAVKIHKPNIIGMSAMLTTTMQSMNDTIALLKEENLLDGLKIMVGGAPLSVNYAEGIGANYSNDASSAVDLANSLVS